MSKIETRPFLENAAEATTACLVTMVQGNLLALGLAHWWVASQTGVAAAAATSAAIWVTRARRPWVVSAMLGVLTTVVDFFVHPGMFGPIFLEAAVTGLGAGVLSYGVSLLLRRATRDSKEETEGNGLA